jgi:ABC-type branched-subunit amino acid transport system ATPase component
VQGLRVVYGDVVVLRDASLSANAGSLTVLTGENGSGKSTLFGAVTGTVHVTAGVVLAGGASLAGLTPPEVARRGVTRVLQRPRLVPTLSVLDNVVFGDAARRGENAALALWPFAWAGAERAARGRALDVLGSLGISALANRKAGVLSGGETKLAAFARARLHGGPIYLFDELLAGVAADERARLVAALSDLARDGATVLCVEHEPSDLFQAGGRALRLVDGVVLSDHEFSRHRA